MDTHTVERLIQDDPALAALIIDLCIAVGHIRRRTQGDGTMHVARKIATDALDKFDKAIRP